MTGKTIAGCKVITKAPKNHLRGTIWFCSCKCGAVITVAGFLLRQYEKQNRIYKCLDCRGKR